ncbi:MAG: MmcQ/YjbR family DNA-binding protein [Chloroflexi bacterium]|nr:MmcQ/YjbR family DNA-binding protein [Chloroflexota bacterium]
MSGDDALARLREVCLAFPEAEERAEYPPHAVFRVRGKTFAWYLENHHGDGRIAVAVKAPPGAQETLLAADPARFFFPPYLGPNGWVGLRLDTGAVDWDEVAFLAEQSYRLFAPKRLLGPHPPAPSPPSVARGG